MAQQPREQIAIIGMGCRFPGGARNPESFWTLLTGGVDAVREVPESRWSSRAFYAPPPSKAGKTVSRWGGFLDGIDQFDADFFGIAPREAASMDPQQRLLLEVAWEALEDAGLAIDRVSGRAVGVFVGASSNDYAQLQWDRFHDRTLNAYTNVGSSLSIIANRLSYLWDLKGPSLVVDTACSSSLVGFHYACESIARGESEMALVAGVNLLLLPSVFVGFSQAHMLSPDGRCRSFDARANGYARAEGVGVLILKPLDRAIADGDRIDAVVLGTGVNQDGRTTGISFPSEQAQSALVREVLARAGVSARDVSYVEAHGTGTPVGDPIEARALGTILGAGRPPHAGLPIGSVKSNFGHLEPASGVAGLIKTVLSMRHRQLAATVHYESPNPQIDFAGLGLRVVARNEAWTTPPGGRRVAAVNSFGFGGTSAHAVLAEAPVSGAEPEPATGLRPSAYLLPLSARSDAALRALAASWQEWIAKTPDLDLGAIAHSAGVRRTHHEHRLAIVAGTAEDVRESIDAWIKGERRKDVAHGKVAASAPATPLRVGFVFNGMGSQTYAMGQELLASEPVFRAAVSRVDAIFRGLSGWSIVDELMREESQSRIDEAEVTQPAIFAVQVGLAALWRSWGVEPALVVGHSVGEVAGTYVAGAISLEDAVRVIYHRSRLQHRLRGRGRMLAVGLSASAVDPVIAPYKHAIGIAAINSPVSVTLSGDADALETVRQTLDASQVFCRFLPVDVPYHSAVMEEIAREFRTATAGLLSSPPPVPYLSTVTGTRLESALDADYWWRNLRAPVQFASAMSLALASRLDAIVEIGAHPVLTQSMRECADAESHDVIVLPSLRRREPECRQLLSSLGTLYTLGLPVHWSALVPAPAASVRLPSYPWQHESFWSESEEVRGSRLGLGNPAGGLLSAIRHPLLGQEILTAGRQRVWRSRLDLDGEHAWLLDHRVQETTVFPAAGFVEMALAAARLLHGEQPICLEDFEIHRPLPLPAGRDVVLDTIVDVLSGDVAIHSGGEERPRHVTGRVRPDGDAAPTTRQAVDALSLEERSIVPIETIYSDLAGIGLEYGPGFRGIVHAELGRDRHLGRIRVPALLHDEINRHQFLPAVLDACLQLVLCPTGGALYLPVRVRRLRLHHPAHRTEFTAIVHRTSLTPALLKAEVIVLDADNHPVATLEGLEAVAFPKLADASPGLDDCVWTHHWELRPRQGSPSPVRMPAPADIAAAVASQIGDALDAVDRARYPEMQRVLERVAAAFAAEALARVGVNLGAGVRVSPHDVSTRLGLTGSQSRLLGAMLRALVADGRLRADAGTFIAIDRAAHDDALTLCRQAWHAWPSLHSWLTMLGRTGPALDRMLGRDASPVDLVFPDGTNAVVEPIYEDAVGARVYNDVLQRAFAAIVASVPAHRPLRILEIGGGTGGAASCILPTLPAERTDYVFTDASQHLISQTEEKLLPFPFVRTAVFDLEHDPDPQTLEPHSFDVILGVDVVHATTDIRRTLERVRGLLAPGGLLLLMEPTGWRTLLDMTFGVLPGWWHFTDANLRTDSPLLTSEGWASVLAESGYRDVAAMPDPVSNGEPMHVVVAARRGEDVHPLTLSPSHPLQGSSLWWVLSDRAGVGEALVSRHRQSGGNAVLIDPSDLQRATAVMEPPQHVVHLTAIDAPAGDACDVTAVREAQDLGAYGLPSLAKSLVEAAWPTPPRLWIVTRAARAFALPDGTDTCVASAPVWGVARTIGNEAPGLRCTAIDVGSTSDEIELDALYQELAANGDETEIVLRHADRYVPRMAQAEPRLEDADASSGVQVVATSPGLIDSVRLRKAASTPPAAGEVQIDVHAAAMNFKDVAKALNLLSSATLEGTWSAEQLGLECSGVVSAVGAGVTTLSVGDRVLALAPGCLRSRINARASIVRRIPDHFSYEDAAGIPVVFMTAHYALHTLARVRAGERILIHAGAGGVGLAAAQVARAAGAEVIATAGNSFKRDYLRTFGVTQVFDSRSLSFVDDVRRLTGGQGVDIVLNSLSGSAIPASLSLLRSGGRFVEIGKRDIQDNVRLGLRPFDRNLAFFGLDLDRLIAERPDLTDQMFDALMADLASGTLAPLPYRTFPVSRARYAFRHVAKAQHIGKVVLRMRDPLASMAAREQAGAASLELDPRASYLVTGGLGGFGLATARWLVDRGARHLTLISRRGADASETREAVASLEAAGASVLAIAADISQETQVRAALDRVRREQPPLKGVFHAAMVLDDGLITQLSAERMERVFAPKAWGAWHLHRLTKNDPLDLFVMFSSITADVGNVGQANYVGACTFLDELVAFRRAQGRPALSVAWGAVGDVGYLTTKPDVLRQLETTAVRALPSATLLGFLPELLRRPEGRAGVSPMDWSALGLHHLPLASSPRLHGLAARISAARTGAETARAAREALLHAPPEERAARLRLYLLDAMATVLGTSAARVDPDRSVLAMGLDSLMAVQLRTRVTKELGCDLSPVRLLGGPTLNELTDELLAQFAN